MHSSDPLLAGLVIAVIVSLALTVGFFAVSGNWTNLANPMASTAALVAGIIGFAAGQAPRLYQRRIGARSNPLTDAP